MKTNTESTHTAPTSGLQWFMHGPDLLTPFSREVIMSAHGEVCRCSGPVDIQKTNAALIVKAVNSHAELVECLRNLSAQFIEMADDDTRENMDRGCGPHWYHSARALLARLEK